MQVFRSIDSGSVEGFPKDVQAAESLVRQQILFTHKLLLVNIGPHILKSDFVFNNVSVFVTEPRMCQEFGDRQEHPNRLY